MGLNGAMPHCGKHLGQKYQSNDHSTSGQMVGHQLKQQINFTGTDGIKPSLLQLKNLKR